MDDVCLIHHDPQILQEMLDITNHVALKYHIEFGAAKCKVVRIGKGKKSAIKLNGQILEEVDTYKYLGELISKKNNLEAHIEATETKIHAVTQNIITETGNKEFKGMKMQAIWQLFDATVIPIHDLRIRKLEPNKKRRKLPPNNPQQSNKNNPSTTPGHPYQHPTGRNRPITHKIHHEQEEDHAGPPTREQGWFTSETHHVW